MYQLFITLGVTQFSVASPNLRSILFIFKHLHVAGAKVRVWDCKNQTFIR